MRYNELFEQQIQKLRLFHGTDADFNDFDRSKLVTAGHIYLTPIKDDAEKYGSNVLVFDFHGNLIDLRPENRGIQEQKILLNAYNQGQLDEYFENFEDFEEAFDNGDMYQTFASQIVQNDVIQTLFDITGVDALWIPDAGFSGGMSESVVIDNLDSLQRIV